MALKIRLARGGSKKRPFYSVVVADSRMPRDGRFIEKIGTYDPRLPKDSESRVQIDGQKAADWIKKGAKRCHLTQSPRQIAVEPVCQRSKAKYSGRKYQMMLKRQIKHHYHDRYQQNTQQRQSIGNRDAQWSRYPWAIVKKLAWQP